MRFEELLDRHERGALTQAEAGEMLGMSERTFRRRRHRWREAGAAGILDPRVGKPSPRRADVSELARAQAQAQALYAEMYGDFTVKHFHEKLVERHGYRLGYTVNRLALQTSGWCARRRAGAPTGASGRDGRARDDAAPGRLDARLARRAAAARPDRHPRRRDERDPFGLLCRGGRAPPRFRGLAEAIARKGLFCSLYTDRGGHYFHTPVAGGRFSRERPTQVGRALAELGIEHVPAYAPEARGRAGARSAPSARFRTGW